MSKFDDRIKDDAVIYARYMDNILREIRKEEIEKKLIDINSYHPALKFTIEGENNQSIPFLDTKIIRFEGKLQST